MSLAQPVSVPGRNPSPGPSGLYLSSNNPFRNRAVSPSGLPASFGDSNNSSNYNNYNNGRPMSRNPFLDPPSNTSNTMNTATSTSPQKSAIDGLADDLFKEMSILDKPITNGGTLPTPGNAPVRYGTLPPNSQSRRRNNSDEQDLRRNGAAPRGPPRSRPAQGGLNIFDSPPKERRPRRNSDTSVLDKDKAEDERRRRERRKEREARRERDGKPSSKPTKKPQGLDLIDKLDVTGIYGQGLFHHDGPFDACNPHRNRKRDQRAPMQAFPTNSANMAIGGAGPVNKNIDLDRFHGRQEDAFTDYATSGTHEAQPMDPALHRPGAKTARQLSFNPTDRVEQVHGEESYGLGTSTFLEGAPASRSAVHRRESEQDQLPALNGPSIGGAGGLARKKSLAMRIRGLSNQRRNFSGESGSAVRSPDARYGGPVSPDALPQGPQSAGGYMRTRQTSGTERNPFFVTSDPDPYEDAYEKQGARIQIAEQERPGGSRTRQASNPRAMGLTRSVTMDSAPTERERERERERQRGSGEEMRSGGGGGFLNRMKSLKGGRRARPERRE